MLKDFAPIKKELKLQSGLNVTVRGLSFYDLACLTESYGDAPLKIFDLSEGVGKLLKNSSAMVTDMICLSCGEPNEQAAVNSLPAGDLLEIVESLLALTLPDPDSIKKLWARLVLMFPELAEELTKVTEDLGQKGKNHKN